MPLRRFHTRLFLLLSFEFIFKAVPIQYFSIKLFHVAKMRWIHHRLPLIFILETMKRLLRYHDKSVSSTVMINGYHYRNRWVAREMFLSQSSHCVLNTCDLWAVLPIHT